MRKTLKSQVGSLPMALLAAIIVGGLVVVLVSRVIATQSQVRFDQGFHASLPTADAGIEFAKYLLNSEGELVATGDDPGCDDEEHKPEFFPLGCSTPVFDGESQEGSFEFLLTRVDEQTWEVQSLGRDTRSGEERWLVASLVQRPLVDVALFADNQLGLRGANMTDAYTSDPEVTAAQAWCRGTGYIASNGPVWFSGGAQPGVTCHDDAAGNRTIDGVYLHDWDDDTPGVTDVFTGGVRCDQAANPDNCRYAGETAGPPGPAREWDEPQTVDEPLTYAQDSEIAFINHALEACKDEFDDELPTWRTSDETGELFEGWSAWDPDQSTWAPNKRFEFPGSLDGPFHCVEDLIFNADTSLAAVTDIDEPVLVVVAGQTRISNHVHVGCDESPGGRCTRGPTNPAENASTPAAGRLWVFTLGEVSLGAQSAFSGVIWAPRTDCVAGAAGGDFYGSLICGDIDGTLGGWRFHFDEELREGVVTGEFVRGAWREELGPAPFSS